MVDLRETIKGVVGRELGEPNTPRRVEGEEPGEGRGEKEKVRRESEGSDKTLVGSEEVKIGGLSLGLPEGLTNPAALAAM